MRQALSFGTLSFICGPQGEFLVLARIQKAKGCSVRRLIFSNLRQLRRIWPYFRDRRVDAHQV